MTYHTFGNGQIEALFSVDSIFGALMASYAICYSFP